MTDVVEDDLTAQLQAYEGRVVGPPVEALDPVNRPMVRHWCEALEHPLPAEGEAPAAMLQVWSMRGLSGRRPRGPGPAADAQDELLRLLDANAFSSVVATDCDQSFTRALREGEVVSETRIIETVSPRKRTRLGEGHFVTVASTYTVAGEVVGTLRLRILKFAPRARAPRPRPTITHDNRFWFEGAEQGRLLIQRCASCLALRHPPGPACPSCRSLEWDVLESSGRGAVHSFTVNHHPKEAAFDYPLVVVLVDLEEGTRLVSNLLDVAPEDVRIGMPVAVDFVRFGQGSDDEITLPQFRPA